MKACKVAPRSQVRQIESVATHGFQTFRTGDPVFSTNSRMCIGGQVTTFGAAGKKSCTLCQRLVHHQSISIGDVFLYTGTHLHLIANWLLISAHQISSNCVLCGTCYDDPRWDAELCVSRRVVSPSPGSTGNTGFAIGMLTVVSYY